MSGQIPQGNPGRLAMLAERDECERAIRCGNFAKVDRFNVLSGLLADLARTWHPRQEQP